MAKRRGRPPKAVLGQTKAKEEKKELIEEVIEAIQEDAQISVPEEIVANHSIDVVDVLEKALKEELEKEVPAKLLAPEIESVLPMTAPESEESEEKVLPMTAPESEESEEEVIPEPEIEVEFDNDPIEIEIPEEPVARMLTAKEHKRFLRTGKMPW